MAAETNPYADDAAEYVNGALAGQATAIRQNMAAAANVNPATEAAHQQLASSTATPLETVRNMADTIRAQAAGQQVNAEALVQRYPATAAVLQDPDKARLVHDDVPVTAQVEQTAKAVSAGQPAGPSLWQRLGSGTFWTDAAKYVFSANTGSDDNLTSDLWRSAQGASGAIGSTFFRALGSVGLAADKINAITGSPTNLADSAFGAAKYYADQADQPGAQGLHNKLVQQVGSLGLQLPMMFATGGAAEVPAAEQGAQSLGQYLAGTLRHATAAMAIPSLTDASETSRKVYEQTGDQVAAARAGLTQYLTSTGSGVVPMSAPGGLLTRLATGAGVGATQGELSRQIMNAALPESMQHQFSWDDLLLSGVSGAMLGGFGPHANTPLPGLLEVTRQRALDAGNALHDEQSLQALAASAAQSKLRERSPQTFSDMVEQATQDGPVSDVWVDAKHFDSVLAQSGVTRPDLERTMPAVADQLDAAIATGGDVRIPVADFATHIAGSGLEEQLLPEMRTAPDAMTANEARAYQTSAEGEMRAAIDKMVQHQQGTDQLQGDGESVRQSIRDQLDATKRFTPQVNDAYSTMLANFYLTQSGRVGLTPREMYERYPVKIGAENPAGDALEQGTHPTDTTEFKQWFGGSKVVDADGKPMVVYHGSPDTGFVNGDGVFKSQRERFGMGRTEGAHWFATSPATARTYADPRRAFDYQNAEPGVVPAYLKMENPLIVDAAGAKWRDAQRRGKTGDVIAEAKEGGHDGVIIRNVRDDYQTGVKKGDAPTDTYVVFDSKQIKHAEKNEGTFDPEHPSILKQTQRGFFDPQTKTLGLLKNADLSTFIHESGHFFLDTLSHLATHPEAPDGIKSDMGTLLDWMGVKDTPERSALNQWHDMTLEQQRQAHEQFARGFEAYVMEGKAPSLEMRGVFQRFRAWLVNVYKSLGALKVELSDDVRGVMDRLLASNDAIRAAEQARAFEPMFKTPEEAQRFGIDADAYHRLADQATQTAIEHLQTRGLKDMAWLGRAHDKALKALEKRAAEARQGVDNEVKAEVYKQPVYQAWQALTAKVRDGEDPTKAVRLNTDDLKQMYGSAPDAAWRKLSTLKMTSGGGLHPDLAADLFGFGSGRDLVEALTKAEHPKTVIDGLTDQRMLERHGELASPEALQHAADEAVHNEARAKFIATELAALDQATKALTDAGRKTKKGHAISVDALASAARQVAEDTVARLKIRDLNPTRFTAAETRAGREAEKALAKGDTQAAATAKRAQMLNNRLAKTAMDAVDEVAAGVKYLRKFDKTSVREAVGVEYVTQIDALLARFDLRQATPLSAAERRQSLLEWVQSQRDKGLEPAVPDKLLDEAQRSPYREMPVEDFRGLLDSVKSIEHLGRMKEKLLDAKGERDLTATVGTLVTRMQERGAKFSSESLFDPPSAKRDGYWQALTHWLGVKMRLVDADLKPQEFKFNRYDLHEAEGPFRRELLDPLLDGNYRKVDLAKRVSDTAAAVAHDLGRDWQRSLYDLMVNRRLIDPELSTPGKPVAMKMTRARMLGIARHVGNESNFDKLVRGYGWHPADVWTFLRENMTAKDWKATQAHWDSFDPLWQETSAMLRRLGGVEPEKIPARAFSITTADGQTADLRGGYSPIDYDPLRSKLSVKKGEFTLGESDRVGDMPRFTATTTRNGSLTNRAEGYTDRVNLDIHSADARIRDTIHDLAYREALINANKIASDERFRIQFLETFGREEYAALLTWLKNIRDTNVDDPRTRNFDKAMQYTRQGVVLTGIGYRVSTVMKHGGAAALKSLGYLGNADGAKYFGARVARMASGHASEDIAAAREKFAEIRTRMLQMDRDYKVGNRSIYEAEGWREKNDRFGHAMVAWSDALSAVPTAWAAYDLAKTSGVPKSMGGSGLPMSEDEAVRYANSVVRQAHGSALEVTRSNFMQARGAKGFFGALYGFMNNTYGQMGDLLDKSTSGGYFRNNPAIAARLMATLIVPALWSQWLRTGSPSQDDGEGWGVWVGKAMAGEVAAMVPFVRDAEALLEHGRGGVIAPMQAVTDAVNSGRDLWNEAHGQSTRLIQDLSNAIGEWAHVAGLGQLGHILQYARGVAEGKHNPDNAAQAAKEAVIGGAKPGR